MIHAVFNRPALSLKVYGPDNRLWELIAATGAAPAGADVHAPYGPGHPVPPGHYQLSGHVVYAMPGPADGAGRIQVDDLDAGAVQQLVEGGRARLRARDVEIAGLPGAAGNLARHRRSGVALHGGGEQLADPLAPFQCLSPTPTGGARLHNADLVRLMALLEPAYAAHAIVLTVVGDP